MSEVENGCLNDPRVIDFRKVVLNLNEWEDGRHWQAFRPGPDANLVSVLLDDPVKHLWLVEFIDPLVHGTLQSQRLENDVHLFLALVQQPFVDFEFFTRLQRGQIIITQLVLRVEQADGFHRFILVMHRGEIIAAFVVFVRDKNFISAIVMLLAGNSERVIILLVKGACRILEAGVTYRFHIIDDRCITASQHIYGLLLRGLELGHLPL